MTTTPVVWMNQISVNNPSTSSGRQTDSRITELRDGRILVSWQDSGDNYDSRLNTDFVGQLYEMNGAPIGQPFLMNTIWHAGSNTGSGSNEERGHDIAAMPDGGWMIVYQDDNGSSTFIRAERFDSSGNLVQNLTLASGSSSGDNHVSDPSIEIASNGDRVVVFSREDGNGTDTRGVVFDNNTFLSEDDYGSRSQLNWAAGSTVNDTSILSNGNIVTVNEDYAGGASRVNVRVTEEDGTNIRSFLTQTSVNPWDWELPTVEALVGGGFVVSYLARNNNSNDYGIRVAIYNNAGQQVVGPFYADFDNNNSLSDLRDSFSDVVALDGGEFLVAWYRSDGIHVQRYNGNGSTIGNELTLATADPGFGGRSRFETFEMTRTQDGRVMLTWVDEDVGAQPDHVQFMILDTRDDGITITGTNSVDALTTPNGGGTVNALAGADNVLGRAGDDTFIDTDLTSGDTYNGRLGIDTIDYSGVTFGGSTTINLLTGTVINSFSSQFDYLENIENVLGSQGNETIVTSADTLLAMGNNGDDRIVVASGFDVNAVYNGGGGNNDTFDLSTITSFGGWTVNLNTSSFIVGSSNVTATGFENIWGSNNTFGAGIETLIGNTGNNEIRGYGGRDHITGGAGIDVVLGGSGSDVFYMSRSDIAQGETVDGGTGTDEISLTGSNGTFFLDRITTLNSVELVRLSTTGLDDTVRFNANQFGAGILANATFIGNAGNETLDIRMNTDTNLDISSLQFTNWSGNYDVEITGDSSSETITGSILYDFIVGNGGNDTIDGGGGTSGDRLDGGTGINTVSYASADAAVTVDLGNQNNQSPQDTVGAGLDILTGFHNLTGSGHGDTLMGNAFANVIRGGAGGDEITGNGGGDDIRGEGGNDTIHRAVTNQSMLNKYDGGDDNDTFIGHGLGAGDLVDLDNGVVLRNTVQFEQITNFENYEGFGAEFLIGTNGQNAITFTGNYVNVIDLNGGDDTVNAGSGDDIISGGAGRDKMYGENGQDTFVIAIADLENNEIVNGGAENDTIRLTDGGSYDFTGVSLESIEIVEYSNKDDDTFVTLLQSQMNGLNFGFEGSASSNSATIMLDVDKNADLRLLSFQNWSSTADEIDVRGNFEENQIWGYFGADILRGAGGNDVFYGSAGSDIFYGDADEDTANYQYSSQGVDVSLLRGSGVQIGGDADGDRLVSIENVTGSANADLLTGDDGDNELRGLAGNDVLNGGAGFDHLYVGSGINTIDGGDDIDIAFFDANTLNTEFARFGDIVQVFKAGSTDRTWATNVEFFNVSGGQASLSNIASTNGLDYIASNTNLIALLGADDSAGVNHYFSFGYYENRDLNTFDEWSYLASNIDLLMFFGSDAYAGTNHYIQHGFGEGRQVDVFDEWGYLASNTDVLANIGADGDAAVEHFVTTGFSEGRVTNSFDAYSYLAGHVDLLAVFGDDVVSATQHFGEHGFSEGRAADIFDEWSYFAGNTDLIGVIGSSGTAAAQHFVQYGFTEGRNADSFDEWSYLASHTVLIGLLGPDGVAATQHYVEMGFGQSLVPDSFDEWSYLASNTDVLGVFGPDGDQAVLHYVFAGFNEGRMLDAFDEWSYLASNTDLIPFYTNDGAGATFHYANHGYGEGRVADNFDEILYLASNGDLIDAFGGDGATATFHYANHGFSEGRAMDFDAVQYLDNYADLAAVYGTDTAGATLHFVLYGYDEGRSDIAII